MIVMKRWLLIVVAFASLSISSMAQIEKANPSFKCSILDDKGTLWLGTKGAGLWRIQGNTVEFYSMLGQQSASDIYAMTLDRQGHLWLTTDRGLLEFDYEQWIPRNLRKEGAENDTCKQEGGASATCLELRLRALVAQGVNVIQVLFGHVEDCVQRA